MKSLLVHTSLYALSLIHLAILSFHLQQKGLHRGYIQKIPTLPTLPSFALACSRLCSRLCSLPFLSLLDCWRGENPENPKLDAKRKAAEEKRVGRESKGSRNSIYQEYRDSKQGVGGVSYLQRNLEEFFWQTGKRTSKMVSYFWTLHVT